MHGSFAERGWIAITLPGFLAALAVTFVLLVAAGFLNARETFLAGSVKGLLASLPAPAVYFLIPAAPALGTSINVGGFVVALGIVYVFSFLMLIPLWVGILNGLFTLLLRGKRRTPVLTRQIAEPTAAE